MSACWISVARSGSMPASWRTDACTVLCECAVAWRMVALGAAAWRGPARAGTAAQRRAAVDRIERVRTRRSPPGEDRLRGMNRERSVEATGSFWEGQVTVCIDGYIIRSVTEVLQR